MGGCLVEVDWSGNFALLTGFLLPERDFARVRVDGQHMFMTCGHRFNSRAEVDGTVSAGASSAVELGSITDALAPQAPAQHVAITLVVEGHALKMISAPFFFVHVCVT